MGHAPSMPSTPPAPPVALGYFYDKNGIAVQPYYNLGEQPPAGMYTSPAAAQAANTPPAPPAPAPPAVPQATTGQGSGFTPQGSLDVQAAAKRDASRAAALGSSGSMLSQDSTYLNQTQSTSTLLGS